MRELLTGGGGRLAQTVQRLYPKIQALSRQQLDITNLPSVQRVLSKAKPDVVYNCAAFTDVDACERNPSACWQANAFGVGNLAQACRDLGIRLVHVSSDFAARPVNQYGWSKRAGESLVPEDGLVLRTNLYGDESFLVRSLLHASGRVDAFRNNRFNPVSYPGFARQMVRLGRTRKTGTLFIGTSKPVSGYQFALEICKTFGLDKNRVRPVPFCSPAVPRAQDLFNKPFNQLTLSGDLAGWKAFREKHRWT